ncbi:MAG: TVP38/TMEM64 family protein [Deltaproteobacteria bacterium]|nr:TVP38/TMEM64 family protein [Deltaproteobacteria bacterium]
MNESIGHPSNKPKHSWVKFIIFAAFVFSAVYVFQFTPIRNHITPETLERLLKSAGFWAPIMYIFFFFFGVCFFLPGTMFTGLGGVIFGPYWGFLYAWVGAMIGASAAFFIGRSLGRDFAASVIGGKLKKYDDAIRRNGFAAVLYLRLVYFPFTPMNFGMGLTKVKFSDYLLGTGLGIMVGTFVFTFFFGTIKGIWTAGNWDQLLSFKVYFSVALFIFSFFIPKIVKKLKTEKN